MTSFFIKRHDINIYTICIPVRVNAFHKFVSVNFSLNNMVNIFLAGIIYVILDILTYITAKKLAIIEGIFFI